jgi:hypothetical protein
MAIIAQLRFLGLIGARDADLKTLIAHKMSVETMGTKRIFYTLAFTALFLTLTFAPTSQLRNALIDLCMGLRGLVPIAAMLMVLLASVIYATGQMMGAETRARANVWATSCLTGALIGILISTIAPPLLSTIAGGTAIQC